MGEPKNRPQLVKMARLAQLAGVPAPTIKHYIREGLLPGPAQRTSRNMAYYDARLAARVRKIKELQQQRFLPLRLIGDLLEPAPSAAVREDLDEEHRHCLGQPTGEGAAGGEALREEEVLALFRVTPDDLKELVRLEVLGPRPAEGFPWYFSGAELELLRLIDETRSRGLEHLFPVEVVAAYFSAVRSLVCAEVACFRRSTQGHDLDPGFDRDQVERAQLDMGERLVVGLRSLLLRRESVLVHEQREPSTGKQSDFADEKLREPWGTVGMPTDSRRNAVPRFAEAS